MRSCLDSHRQTAVRGQEAMLMPTQLRCYLVQKTESVFHPAKLASGANYPVGWVQMPHSVRSGGGGEGALGKGKDWGGSRERTHPGVHPPRLFRFDLGVRATAESRLFPHWVNPGPVFVVFFVRGTKMLFCRQIRGGSRPVQLQIIHWWPMSNFTG